MTLRARRMYCYLGLILVVSALAAWGEFRRALALKITVQFRFAKCAVKKSGKERFVYSPVLLSLAFFRKSHAHHKFT